MSSSNSPCAACKFLRRKCTVGCIFAPYFPPDQPTKFANVHKVFGASNVGKLLVDLPATSREQAVISLAYEAQARLHDPVLGCVGHVYALEQRLAQVRAEMDAARKELAMYIGPAAYGSFLQQAPHHHGLVGGAFHQPQYQYYRNPQGASSSSMQPQFGAPGLGLGMGLGLAAPAPMPQEQMLMRDQQQQQAQMLMREQQQAQMLMREQQQQHQAQMLLRGGQPPQQQGQMLMLEQHQHAQMLMRDQQQLHHRQQRIAEDEQLALAIANVTREQEMLRNFAAQQQQHQQQQQLQEQELFNLGFPENVRGYDQIAFGGATIAVAAEPPSGLALVPPQPFDGSFMQEPQQQALQYNEQQQQQQQQQQQHHQYNEEQLLQQLQLQEEQQHTQPHHQRVGSDEGRSAMAPSS